MSKSNLTDKIISQISDIRTGGLANMVDYRAVQYYANQQHFYELVIFIEEHRDEYSRYILTGKP
jgi:hypothetical protein